MRSLDMKYSVLMPVYRKENPSYFYRAAFSMMKQSVPPDEFVLVCDGPLTEELDAVIRELEETWFEQVKVVRRSKAFISLVMPSLSPFQTASNRAFRSHFLVLLSNHLITIVSKISLISAFGIIRADMPSGSSSL